MLNTNSKGSKNELKAQRRLETEGWLVFRPYHGGRFNKQKDIWNLFDMQALRGSELKFIQVKSNYCPKQVKWACQDFTRKHGFTTETWTWVDRIGWKIEVYHKEVFVE